MGDREHYRLIDSQGVDGRLAAVLLLIAALVIAGLIVVL